MMYTMFQLTAARRRLEKRLCDHGAHHTFQLTAARRRLDKVLRRLTFFLCFNSQPPEGGWGEQNKMLAGLRRFNSQPPEGGWCLR